MERIERISEINQVLQDYFQEHPDSEKIAAKEFMPLFIKKGIFKQNNRDGLPIRKLLRELDKDNLLSKIPYIHAERKEQNTNWYFRRISMNEKKTSKKEKNYLAILLLIFFINIFISCSSNTDTIFPEISHVAFQANENDKWGLIGTNGKVLFENKFDNRPSYVVNGVFRTYDWDTKKFLYYSATENPELIGSPKGYTDGGLCSEGIIPVVSSDERIHYIRDTGETAFYLLPYKDKEFFGVCPFFTEQRAWFLLENQKYGYIDTQGNVIVEPIYDNAFPFHEGKAIVYKEEEDKWLAIDVNGKELFEVSSNGYQQHSGALYNNDYCLIENFLLNKNGEKVQRFPPNIYCISPFINNVALFQDSNTRLWGQINIQGENIGEEKYTRALGIVNDLVYVGDTIPNLKDKWGNNYMNVYTINSKGEIQNRIENVSCCYPLSKSIIMAENGKYYFADKKGNPINNNSYYKISVPPFTDAPSYSPLWSFLVAPHTYADYNAWEVASNYIDDKKTVGSIFEKLTSEGIGKLKLGQHVSEVMDLFNKKRIPVRGWADLDNKDYGINRIFANYSIGIYDYHVIVIKGNIDTSLLPINNASKRIAQTIPAYLTKVLGLTKIKSGNSYRYRSEKYSYDIIYYDGETMFFLMPKSITGDIN